MPDVQTMSERTLRWPGHAEAVRPLVESGRFIEEFRTKCSANPPRDLVAMMTVVKRGMKVQRATLIDRYDEASQLSAMARTTALTTSAVAQWVAGGGSTEPGVTPLERVGPDQRAYTAITSALEKHGVRVQWDWGA
jgi:saccharopine dehydrogenase-like NADP-dependent oxidoreductase